MNAQMMRKSPPPRPSGDAAAFPPLCIPSDAPPHANHVLAALDAAITREAKSMLETSPPRSFDDVRLAIAGRMHARSDGAAAFFLFHYLRLLGGQADSRGAGSTCLEQTWAIPDWSPPPPSEVWSPRAPRPEHETGASSRTADRMEKARPDLPELVLATETS